ncbi:alpha-keto acid decarboxylase family protein [Pseudonocardia endophytica]|uniref:Alpha-keto-acid decarboxylase n=1 Tax=Pseudonocardia endophytica TaxID=401976 RepID=A0A4R1HG66_PSEEN|nr:thiamine pyrophosphate-binding protein [Pseudonocardia endophytica]TCK21154.1 indolepyruvate decarboxylase [Pseudonocardia endophytica]
MSDHPRTTVGAYLATRLVQLGADHLFGLPGDFNLSLLDEMLTVDGLDWVGSTNELNASYAADGFARVGRRVGAFLTTYGVGELSALNGVAGSYAEDVPVVHVVGMPSRSSMDTGAPLHHTFLDGDFRRFERMSAEITAHRTVLDTDDPDDLVAEIDRVLRGALESGKPVYIGVPLDVATAAVPSGPIATPLRAPQSDTQAVAEFTDALRRRFDDVDRACLLVGPKVHRCAQEDAISSIAALPGVQVATQSGSKAILDETHPASLGTYLGATTRSDAAREAVDTASPLVMVGTVHSDFTTGFFTHGYDPGAAVELAVDRARIGRAVYPGVRMADALAALRDVVTASRLPQLAPVDLPATAPDTVEGDTLDQERFWGEVQQWLQPSTTVIAEAGTAFYGALDLSLAPDSDLLGQPVWSSIGYTLPATLGAGLAAPGRRPVLFIGDGSAQLTIQELGTVFARGLTPVVFVLNNSGYTVEREIQSPDAVYQDIVGWNWTQVPSALGAPGVTCMAATTPDELRDALAKAAGSPDAAFLIEVHLPRRDAPRLLAELARGINTSNA